MEYKNLFEKLPAGRYIFIGLAILIFVLAVFFRLWQLPSAPPGLYPDEAINANNGIEAANDNDFKIFFPDNNGREGLFIDIVGLNLKVFGGDGKPWAARLPSAIFGILGVLGIYLLAREIFNDNQLLTGDGHSWQMPYGIHIYIRRHYSD